MTSRTDDAPYPVAFPLTAWGGAAFAIALAVHLALRAGRGPLGMLGTGAEAIDSWGALLATVAAILWFGWSWRLRGLRSEDDPSLLLQSVAGALTILGAAIHLSVLLPAFSGTDTVYASLWSALPHPWYVGSYLVGGVGAAFWIGLALPAVGSIASAQRLRVPAIVLGATFGLFAFSAIAYFSTGWLPFPFLSPANS